MEKYRMKVKLTFTEEMLGTASSDEEIYSTFIASKTESETDDELEALARTPEYEDKPVTVFTRDENGNPTLWDYQVKGFFKDTCGGLRKITKSESAKVKAYKKTIDKLIFVEPRVIPINMNGGEIGECQRPLRASTAQGERIALAYSETVPKGSTIEFEIASYDEKHKKLIEEWLDYGVDSGIGQWRNSGKGRFTYEIVEEWH